MPLIVSLGAWRATQGALSLTLHAVNPYCKLNRMVQYCQTRFDVSFGSLADATRRGVLEQLGRADASITALAKKFHMTLTGMKKHVGVTQAHGNSKSPVAEVNERYGDIFAMRGLTLPGFKGPTRQIGAPAQQNDRNAGPLC